MTEKPAPGVRARVRSELTNEIKVAASQQLIDDGAAGLSLRAIAREMGMASSAIYRYFASRDELLTALIIDAYNDLGEAVEKAAEAVEADGQREQLLAIAKAIRAWALANPQHYALVYGSPIPGYAAPQDTVGPASRVGIALLTTLHGPLPKRTRKVKNPKLEAALDGLLELSSHAIPAPILAQGVEIWAGIFGLVSLELFGHFENSVTDPEAFFDYTLEAMVKRLLG